eukprot:COSAG01_NODE_3213_length_6410_cov_2.970211_3_plen_58_part_00
MAHLSSDCEHLGGQARHLCCRDAVELLLARALLNGIIELYTALSIQRRSAAQVMVAN